MKKSIDMEKKDMNLHFFLLINHSLTLLILFSLPEPFFIYKG
jgi:hypothetical protein